MAQPPDEDKKDSSASRSDRRKGRGPRKRRRTLLNLGVPFPQVDDFLNQSEDAVILACRVSEQMVNEIKAGYDAAKQFNNDVRRSEEEGLPPPPVPWVKFVERVESLQDLAINSFRESTDIFFDSLRSTTSSMKSLARTWELSRKDVEQPPILAGPVFEDPIDVTASPGERPKETRFIDHPGLTRLRIYAEVNPPLQRLRAAGSTEEPARLEAKATFEPDTDPEKRDKRSILTVEIGPITNQPPGLYEGIIRASNFALFIAKLRVQVTGLGPGPDVDQSAATTAERMPRPRPTARRNRSRGKK